jgi:membrane protein
LAKFGFSWASARMVQVHKIYGSLAVLPIVLTWIYISWVIALVGCRLCYAFDASRKPRPHPGLAGVLARETFVARTMIAVAQLHRELERPVSAQRLASELSASRRMLREALGALSQGGLVVEALQGGFLPGRDLGQIDFGQVRAAARASVAFPLREEDALDRALRALWEQADGAARGTLTETLASFLVRTGSHPVSAVAQTGQEAAPLLGPLARGPRVS